MMYERMAPEEPINDPTIVNMLFESMKPSEQRAHPEYEFKTVMATGISAEPIELVIFQPKAKDEKVAQVNAVIPRTVLSEYNIAENAKRLEIPNGKLSCLFIGRS